MKSNQGNNVISAENSHKMVTFRVLNMTLDTESLILSGWCSWSKSGTIPFKMDKREKKIRDP